MKKFSIRTAEPSDSQNYFEWLQAASDINLVDPAVYSYPTCNTVAIDKGDEPVLMNSFHAPLMMEALAPKPGLSPMDEARALRTLYEGIRNIAPALGHREIWFSCIDARLQKFVEKKGFQRVYTPMYRMLIGRDNDPLNERRPGGYQPDENSNIETIE